MQLLYTTIIIIIVTRCKVYNKKKKNELYEKKWKDNIGKEEKTSNVVCKEGRTEFSGKVK